MTRTYVVLVERTVDTDVGDTVFVLLGYYDATRASIARKRAARDAGLGGSEAIVSVAASNWKGKIEFIQQPAMVMGT